ncbi:MAG TPA: cytidyltransferase [Thiotrichaceae bacterium]|nr:cytidyltransferase [Thiotrichaceae bacterium]
MYREKIISLDTLAEIAENHRKQGNKIILCHGCFDLLHIGHIRYLNKARSLGDELLVTLTADEYVNKGPGRPVFPAKLRAEHMAALSMVSYVAVNHAATAVNVINKIKPHLYVKGNEYENAEEDLSGNIRLEQEATEAWGGKIFFTHEATFSSSSLLNKNFNLFPPETEHYLKRFSQHHNIDKIVAQVEQLRGLKVAVIGDAIIDEYHYTEPLGQTGKGNILAVKYQSMEKFAGGAIAVANHIAGFVDQVTLLSALGQENSQEPFIRNKLAQNVRAEFLYFTSAPTVIKRRYVDADSSAAKLFEVYFYEEEPRDQALEQAACQWIQQNLSQFDLVVVSDFGNGFIAGDMIPAICDEAKFLSVNTQINSGNRGYHVITRYPHADFIALNEPELRLAAHDRYSALTEIATQIGEQLEATKMAITRGTLGAMMLSLNHKEASEYNCPALSTKIVDRVGAGDSFLALASLCLAGKMSPEISLFVASSAAALDVQIVCNRESIAPISLYKYMNTLLK